LAYGFEGTVSRDFYLFFCLDDKISASLKALIVFNFFAYNFFVKINSKFLCNFLQIGLEFSQISLNPLAVVSYCFSKAA
jgi:hypothetical protein